MKHRFAVPIDDLREGAEEVCLLPEASAQDWAAIFRQADPLRLDAGQTLVKAGQQDTALYLLTEGDISAIAGSSGVPFKTIEAPSVLGEIAFLDGAPRTVTLVAATDCIVARIDRAAYEDLAIEEPELARQLALDLGRIAAVRLRLVSERIVTLGG